MKYTSLLIILFFMGLSCTVKPEKINYGNDSCHFCKMTIVNKLFAAELVTNKGRSYKYDALECMLDDLKNWDSSQVNMFLVTNYLSPTEIIDANKATFLISDKIKSPMGANLASFKNRSDALDFTSSNQDNIFSWPEIKTQFNP